MSLRPEWALVPFLVVVVLTSRSAVTRRSELSGDSVWTIALTFALTALLAFGGVAAALIVAAGAILDFFAGRQRNRVAHLFRAARTMIGLIVGGFVINPEARDALTLPGDEEIFAFLPFLGVYLLIQVVALTGLHWRAAADWRTLPYGWLDRFRWPPLVTVLAWEVVIVLVAASLALIIDTIGQRTDYWVACVIAFVLLFGLVRLLELNILLRERNVELARALTELRTLNAVGHVLSATIDLDQLCVDLADQMRRLTRADATVIALIDPARTRVRIAYYAYGGVRQPERFEEMPEPSVGPPVSGGGPVPRSEANPVAGDGIINQVLALRRSVVTSDTERFTIVRPDGTSLPEGRSGVRHFHSSVGVPLQVAGELIGAVALKSHQPGVFDPSLVTLLERIANQAALALRNAEVIAGERAANRAKQDFLAVVSHELRTPITSISGYSQLLSRRLTREAKRAAKQESDSTGRRDSPVPDAAGATGTNRPLASYLEMTEVISEQSRHLGHLVDDLVTLSGLGQGTMRYQMEPLDLAVVVSEAVAGAQLSMDEPASLRLEIAEGATVIGDRRRLRSVLDNLIGNAIIHGPASTPIDVWLGHRRDAAEIRVTDHGRGIAMAVQAHVFEPFFRGADERDELQRGLGLGLSISREIVTAHGGTISVLSDEGAGATFIVRLQLATTPDDAGAGAPAPAT